MGKKKKLRVISTIHWPCWVAWAKNEETGAKVEEEEEVACDFDDPLAMLGGMGEEEVYKVTLLDEAAPEEANADEEDEGDAKPQAEEDAAEAERKAAEEEAERKAAEERRAAEEAEEAEKRAA